MLAGCALGGEYIEPRAECDGHTVPCVHIPIPCQLSMNEKVNEITRCQAMGELRGAWRRAAACGADVDSGRQPLGGHTGSGAALHQRCSGPQPGAHGRCRHCHPALLHERPAARRRSPHPGKAFTYFSLARGWIAKYIGLVSYLPSVSSLDRTEAAVQSIGGSCTLCCLPQAACRALQKVGLGCSSAIVDLLANRYMLPGDINLIVQLWPI